MAEWKIYLKRYNNIKKTGTCNVKLKLKYAKQNHLTWQQCSSVSVQQDHTRVVRLRELWRMQISIKSERGLQHTNVLLWIYPGFGNLVKNERGFSGWDQENQNRGEKSYTCPFSSSPFLTLFFFILLLSRSLRLTPQSKHTSKYVFKTKVYTY